jgi:hypothetical protein
LPRYSGTGNDSQKCGDVVFGAATISSRDVIRAGFYLSAAAIVWLTEGFIFSRFLDFDARQVTLMAVVYVGLFASAILFLIRTSARDGVGQRLPRWRMLSAAPMISLILGSFVSLPVLLVVASLGRWI